MFYLFYKMIFTVQYYAYYKFRNLQFYNIIVINAVRKLEKCQRKFTFE
jgi:hypothetical protein